MFIDQSGIHAQIFIAEGSSSGARSQFFSFFLPFIMVSCYILSVHTIISISDSMLKCLVLLHGSRFFFVIFFTIYHVRFILLNLTMYWFDCLLNFFSFIFLLNISFDSVVSVDLYSFVNNTAYLPSMHPFCFIYYFK